MLQANWGRSGQPSIFFRNKTCICFNQSLKVWTSILYGVLVKVYLFLVSSFDFSKSSLRLRALSGLKERSIMSVVCWFAENWVTHFVIPSSYELEHTNSPLRFLLWKLQHKSLMPTFVVVFVILLVVSGIVNTLTSHKTNPNFGLWSGLYVLCILTYFPEWSDPVHV